MPGGASSIADLNGYGTPDLLLAGTAGFEVQRREASERGRREGWTTVGFVEGAGTEPRAYRFTDTDMPYAADSLAYRLRQVDTDGSTTVSDPVIVHRGAPGEVRLRTPFRYRPHSTAESDSPGGHILPVPH